MWSRKSARPPSGSDRSPLIFAHVRPLQLRFRSGGRAGRSRLRGVDQGRSPRPRDRLRRRADGDPVDSASPPGVAGGRGADKNNGLGEAFSGSSPATADRRSMMVSRVSPTALRIGSPTMIAHAQAHCNSGSDFWTSGIGLGPILDQPHHGSQSRAAFGQSERVATPRPAGATRARPPRADAPGDGPPARRLAA